jgi:hypothetical protein
MNGTMEPTNLEKVQEQLRQRLRGQLREVRVFAHEGHVQLEGVAVSYYAKQLAQHLVLRELGQPRLVNRIAVERLAPPPDLGAAEID